MSRVAVSEHVLRWAIERADLTPDDLVPQFPKIREWISGVAQPTVPQLREFARRTLTPFGFLFLSKPPTEHLPVEHFRTVAATAPTRPSA